MIRIGIISDIHGYLTPLERALALLADHRVDQIICAGDLVGQGTDGDAIVHLIRQLNIPSVLGNKDAGAFLQQAMLRREVLRSGKETHPGMMTSESVAFVHSLPPRLDFKTQGVRVCVAHGIPGNNKQYLFRDAFPEWLDEATQASNADVLVLGHTQVPMVMVHKEVLIVNPGSVANNKTALPSKTCGILTLPEREFAVYNVETGDLLDPNSFSMDDDD